VSWRWPITAGQRSDGPQFQPVLDRVNVPRPGPGRPRTRPVRVLADKAYPSRANRAYLRRRGIQAVIPEKQDQRRNRQAKGRQGGRPPVFDREAYQQRNTIERTIGRLKRFRAFPVPVVVGHGLFAATTLVLVLLAALGVGGS
jgi:transposase